MISENKSKTIQVRVTEADYKYLQMVSAMCGMNPSQYVRTLIKATVNAAKVKEKKGGLAVEDFNAVFDDQL